MLITFLGENDMENEYYPFVNLPLPYDYSAMEPYIDAKTMMLHHDGHLQAYINNLNDILKNYPRLQRLSLEELIKYAARLPRRLRDIVSNNAGGVYNHRMYFDTLKNPSDKEPAGRLKNLIDQQYGGTFNLLMEMKKAAMSVFGSGYAWLALDHGRLRIVTTPNQNSPVAYGYCPILPIDVWEHAYYLKHYNMRADYIDDWMKVINWDRAERNYNECVE